MRHVAGTRRRRIASGWTGRGAGALPDRALPGSASRSRRGARDRAAWGVAPEPRCRETGVAIPRVPDKAVDQRLEWRKSQRSRDRGKTINVAFGLSQQCGSGCPAQASDCPLQLTERALWVCAGACGVGARVHRWGMRLRGSVAAGNRPGSQNALALARIHPFPTTEKATALHVRGQLQPRTPADGSQKSGYRAVADQALRRGRNGHCGGQEGLAGCQVASFKPFIFVVRIGV